jgi:hypothetical protein
MSRTLLSLAGFQVIISGRFWVIAEAVDRMIGFELFGGQVRTKSAMNRGFQTRNVEMDLSRMLGELVEP